MAIRPNGAVRRGLETLFHLGTIGDLSDGQLLERFTTSGGDAAELAFTALVERHGPMVLRVCRSSLNDPNDAQDAFQATFLVLVRKARALWVQDSLGPWLHRVAHRVASRARRSAARRRDHERRAAETRPMVISDGDDWKDVFAILHEEIDRLPDRCRLPLVLCDLEGLTHEQVARHLGWPIGTVKSRLTRGREWLRTRLVRRGLAPTAGLMGGASIVRSTSAAVPAGLMDATVRAARSLAAGAATAGVVPATVALLVEGALNAMFLSKMKSVVLAFGILATGAFVVAQQERRPPDARNQPVKAATTTSPAALSEAVLSTTSSVSIGSATSSPAEPSDAPDDEASIEATVELNMARLDIELLREELQIYKNRVQTAFGKKTRAELGIGETPGGGRSISADELKNAQIAYEGARASYRTKVREMWITQRRLELSEGKLRQIREIDGRNVNLQRRLELSEGKLRQADHERPAGTKPPSHTRGGDPVTAKSAPQTSGAAIGSVDMDAVLKHYDKVQELHDRLAHSLGGAKQSATKSQAQIEKLMSQLQKLAAGSSDYIALESRISELKERFGAQNEESQRDFTRRQVRIMAALYEEIQAAIAGVAKAKGLDYVVKVSSGPLSDSNPDDVHDALRRSVIYANPRNDLTDEVIHELNRKFHAAEAKPAQ